MKAMILAAGKGTRVQPITHVIPKPMIPILQKPVMEFLLELLKEHGFTEVMVNVSHLAEEIENYFRDGQRFDALETAELYLENLRNSSDSSGS